MPDKKLTPLMEQYFSIKERYKDEILLFRMGDFYEMFDKDAIKASKILNITLTSRNRETDDCPLCGIPYHSITKYMPKLLDAGLSIAICEQIEDPKYAKGIVKRDVIRVITPGTIIEQEYLREENNNYLCSIAFFDNNYGILFIDVSTQEIKMTSIHKNIQRLCDEIAKFNPTEIIISSDQFQNLKNEIEDQLEIKVNFREFKIQKKAFKLWKKDLIPSLPAKNLQYIALDEKEELLLGLFQADEFIKEKGIRLNFESEFDLYNTSDYMDLDSSTIKHLEIYNTDPNLKTKTLFDLLNNTKTAMGSRTTRFWLLNPLQDKMRINQRSNAIEYFYNNSRSREKITELLKDISDIERINGRIIHLNANPRDLIALRQSLISTSEIKEQLKEYPEEIFSDIVQRICDFSDTIKLIEDTILPDPPSHTRDGNYIHPQKNPELAELVHIIENSQKLILEYEEEQKKLTGIHNLKVSYNKVFGYFIDIPKSKSGLALEHYKKKQTLVNSERYITPELQKLEHKILNAEEKRISLEKEIYSKLLESLKLVSSSVKSAAIAIGTLDTLISFCNLAKRNRYTKPFISDEPIIDIQEGRHPLVESFLNIEFIPNDLNFNESDRFFIITGPNMAGKSTYLRQNALIVLMAHIGCYVPAKYASIPIIDRVFTRIGSADFLSKGMSTFLVEMSETALILKKSTDRSLILLDEVGRGTSTYDGISIAWAISEYIYKEIGAYTMFATHYNELTILADEYDGIVNHCIQVKEYNNKLIFLRKIIPGIADKSYGIDVAEMAGIPFEIIQKARKILKTLESNDSNNLISGLKGNHYFIPEKPKQKTLFERESNRIRDTLQKVDINNTTPIEALLLLEKLKKM